MRSGQHLLGLRRIGGVGGDQEKSSAAVAVADSRQTGRVTVDGHHTVAGCQKCPGKPVTPVGSGIEDQNERTVLS